MERGGENKERAAKAVGREMRSIKDIAEMVAGGSLAVNEAVDQLFEQGPTMSKRQAGFVKAANTNHCRDCAHYAPPHACGLVAGVVWPHSTCQYFKGKQ